MSVGAFRSVLNDLVGCSESHLWSLVVLGFDVHLVVVVHVKEDRLGLVVLGLCLCLGLGLVVLLEQPCVDAPFSAPGDWFWFWI